jgi:hypothetical protein
MKRINVLAAGRYRPLIMAACRPMGATVHRSRLPPPGAAGMLVMDLPAFMATLSEAGGSSAFARRVPGPAVVLTADNESPAVLAALARAGAIGVPEAAFDLLPSILRRLSGGPGAGRLPDVSALPASLSPQVNRGAPCDPTSAAAWILEPAGTAAKISRPQSREGKRISPAAAAARRHRPGRRRHPQTPQVAAAA